MAPCTFPCAPTLFSVPMPLSVNQNAAPQETSGLALNKVVEVKSYGMDRYNRMLVVIFLEGKNINLEMVKGGFGEVYDGRLPRGFDIAPYLEAEKEAREAIPKTLLLLPVAVPIISFQGKTQAQFLPLKHCPAMIEAT